MTWIASANHKEGRFSPNGLGTDRQSTPQVDLRDEATLKRGTLMLETRMSPTAKPQILFAFNRSFPKERSLSIQALPGGGIALVHNHNGEMCQATLRWRDSGRADVVRISFSWDVAANWGKLTLEHPEETTVASIQIASPNPLYLQDLHDVLLAKGDRTFSNDVVFVALSNNIEAVGPMPTLTLNMPVATPSGHKKIQHLKRGDTVQTAVKGVVPILQRITRTVPALGSFAPIRLRAPYFGLLQDIVVAPDQRLVIRGSDVEYLFGQEAVLVPARHLVNGFAALYEPTGPTITYTHLLLPEHETLSVAGSAFESLNIGRIRRKQDQLNASLLSHFERNSLPEHGKPVFPILKAYEAITLAQQRAA
ncbi:MAG: Hint domain-containing protein [Lentilitoribacter sp.]